MRRPLSLSAALLALPLTLAPVACKRSAAIPDSTLASAVQTRIQADAALGTEPIQTGVQNGVVTLNGTVSSAAARALAADDAAQVQGVRTVVNNLTVATAQTAAQPSTPDVATADTPAAVPAPATQPSVTESRRDRERRERAERAERAAAARQNSSQPRNQTPVVAQNTPIPAPVAPVPSPVQQQAPAAPPAPVTRNLTVPAGTVLPIRITQTLDSATTQQGDTFSGSVASDVVVDGSTVLRQGSSVTGRVTAVQEAAHFKGNSLLSIELTGISRHGDRVTVSTEPYSVQGKGRGKNTLEKSGGGAAIGAILGGIFGGGSGAAIGAAAGGGAGAGVNAITRGQQVQIPAESLVRFRLSSPVSVRVSGASASEAPISDDSTPSQRRPLSQ